MYSKEVSLVLKVVKLKVKWWLFIAQCAKKHTSRCNSSRLWGAHFMTWTHGAQRLRPSRAEPDRCLQRCSCLRPSGWACRNIEKPYLANMHAWACLIEGKKTPFRIFLNLTNEDDRFTIRHCSDDGLSLQPDLFCMVRPALSKMVTSTLLSHSSSYT